MREENPILLAIETSCDDTAAAIFCNKKLKSSVTRTQLAHRKYGGVVPELASRAHLQEIWPVVNEALKQAETKLSDLHAIAYTIGPGLGGSLMVGSGFAKGLAAALKIPLIPVDHMRGHILAHFINNANPPEFPFLNLTVSGGHTQLVLVESAELMKVLGETTDDAMGEAFDKAAKILGLPYPGGPEIDRMARQGNPKRFSFPKPKANELNFSFSGLKTAFLYFIRDQKNANAEFVSKNMADICASWQSCLVDYALRLLIEARRLYPCKHVAISGGVAANSMLRERFVKTGLEKDWKTHVCPLSYSTDNAAMIGMAGLLLYEQQALGKLSDLIQPDLSFS